MAPLLPILFVFLINYCSIYICVCVIIKNLCSLNFYLFINLIIGLLDACRFYFHKTTMLISIVSTCRKNTFAYYKCNVINNNLPLNYIRMQGGRSKGKGVFLEYFFSYFDLSKLYLSEITPFNYNPEFIPVLIKTTLNLSLSLVSSLKSCHSFFQHVSQD